MSRLPKVTILKQCVKSDNKIQNKKTKNIMRAVFIDREEEILFENAIEEYMKTLNCIDINQ